MLTNLVLVNQPGLAFVIQASVGVEWPLICQTKFHYRLTQIKFRIISGLMYPNEWIFPLTVKAIASRAYLSRGDNCLHFFLHFTESSSRASYAFLWLVSCATASAHPVDCTSCSSALQPSKPYSFWCTCARSCSVFSARGP